MKPAIIAFTPGEPAGIGPDLAVQIAQQQTDYCRVAIADPNLLEQRAEKLDLPLKVTPFNGQVSRPGTMQVIPIHCAVKPKPGKLTEKNAPYVLETIKTATVGCLKRQFDALVTGPIQKSIINQAGIKFSGHTEYLAALTDTAVPVMMLANQKLRVALVTTHLPLSQVSEAISTETIVNVIQITHTEMVKKFAVPAPRLAVCGLNPHAGESGHLGREEIEIITPVIDKLNDTGFNLLGPLPADTAFTPKVLNQVDAVIAMYHDQGLPVVKALGFGETVNITLGLPIIRTSVDHGTALDLAGSGNSDSNSLHAAFAMANGMAANRHQT